VIYSLTFPVRGTRSLTFKVSLNERPTAFTKFKLSIENDLFFLKTLDSEQKIKNLPHLSYVKIKLVTHRLRLIFRKTLDDGTVYLRGLFLIFFIDACVTDDEPL